MRNRREKERAGSSEPSPRREGVFDTQLSFPSLSTPITAVVKRSGGEEPFEPQKVADSILKAGEDAQEGDRALANSLASGVAIFLGRTVQGRQPTTVEIRSAVERVLLEMGHSRIAAAYARHHRKRERLRKLREGDIRGLLQDEESDALDLQEGRAGAGAGLFVRTSDERLAEWDRERIVVALVRETGMERPLAETIAGEVEDQVRAAEVKTLTASLVRELVDAKLIEHGLERYRQRHRRLGVPLYDAEQIVCAPNQGVREGRYHPGTTDAALAERVKKEYALTQVFSQEVADAHFRGDLQLCGLGLIDRLHAGVFTLEQVCERTPAFGGGISADAESLFGEAAVLYERARPHFADSIVWDAVNVELTPHVGEDDPHYVAHLAHLFLWTFDPPGQSGSKSGAEAVMRLRAGASHVPGFAEAILEAFAEAKPFSGNNLRLMVELGESFWEWKDHAEFLGLLVGAAAASANVLVEFTRQGSKERPKPVPGQCPDVTVHEVVVNLPRAAYRALREAPLAPEQGVLAELERVVRLAAQAHVEKREFIERLMVLKDVGPLGFLAAECGNAPLVDLDQARYLVSFAGLNECVQALTGERLHESEPARDLGLRILDALRRQCRQLGETHDLRLAPAHHSDESVASRFALLDLQAYEGLAKKVVTSNPVTQDIGYTPGARTDPAAEMSPIDRVRLEGVFHEAAPEGALSVVPAADGEVTPEALGDFLKNAFHRTACRRLAFRR